ncbi:MAG: ArsB/NhaD family transporter [Anaerolineae bacterium]|nr:ArsB/NhaD family transporter [Anaerolineae bacterium]
MNQALLAGAIFLLTYAVIVNERVPRALSAVLGAVLMILAGIVDQEHAFDAVDWNVIFLLAGMMAIANVLRETGVFQWVGVQAVKLGKGDPFRIMAVLTLVTGLASAVLDNVTIVVLVAPVTLLVAANLRMNPLPFLMVEILASNIGGTATMIGDPPNILIASAADIDFVTFAANLAPISFSILLLLVGLAGLLFRRELRAGRAQALDVEALDTSALITDRPLLAKAVVVLVGVLGGFLVHGAVGLEPATIAVAGATVLLIWGRANPHDIMRDIEWTTLAFFVGLFILVEAVVRVGIIGAVGRAAVRLTGGSLPLTSMILLWLSAFVSGMVDNIPYTATMIPIVRSLAQSMPARPLWWSLALGACLGGNTTLVGASANLVVASLAERSGYPISFGRFLRYGVSTTVMSLLLASAYLWLRYL